MNKQLFLSELKKININISTEQLKQLELYYKLLLEWNNKINLTSITNEEQVYLKHFYDSLTITKVIDLDNQSLCDIGTGAGFPGIVLKIIFPNLKVTLIEAIKKKCLFLECVINTLGLTNISVINERAEVYSRNIREEYDIVTCRAVANLDVLLEYSIPLVKIDCYFIPMKAKLEEELVNINTYLNKLNITIEKKEEFILPIENSIRTLIVFKKNKITDSKYPRSYNEIKKHHI